MLALRLITLLTCAPSPPFSSLSACTLPLRTAPPLCPHSALRSASDAAGVTLAHYLESSTAYHIILIEKRDYFEYTPSMLRVMREPEHMAISHLRYADLRLLQRPRVTIVQDEVVAVREGAVVTKSGNTIAYNKLVLAMGSDYPGQETHKRTVSQLTRRRVAHRTHSPLPLLRSCAQII